jgi:hypothetical protein
VLLAQDNLNRSLIMFRDHHMVARPANDCPANAAQHASGSTSCAHAYQGVSKLIRP